MSESSRLAREGKGSVEGRSAHKTGAEGNGHADTCSTCDGAEAGAIAGGMVVGSKPLPANAACRSQAWAEVDRSVARFTPSIASVDMRPGRFNTDVVVEDRTAKTVPIPDKGRGGHVCFGSVLTCIFHRTRKSHEYEYTHKHAFV